MQQFLIQHCNISVNGFGSVWKWGYPNFFRPATLNQRGHSIITFSQNDQNLDPPLHPLVLFYRFINTCYNQHINPTKVIPEYNCCQDVNHLFIKAVFKIKLYCCHIIIQYKVPQVIRQPQQWGIDWFKFYGIQINKYLYISLFVNI